jgi:biotin-dependent carboxylase-like uncharacterized protein
MTAAIRVTRAGPSTTLQDAGRFGGLQHGISASGPMDRGAFAEAGRMLGHAGAAIEFTRAGIGFEVTGGPLSASCAGAEFSVRVNGKARTWSSVLRLKTGDSVEITPGASGNFGYLRFDREIDVPLMLGSRSTNLVAGLGGLKGRALKAGDALLLMQLVSDAAAPRPPSPVSESGPIRFIWGLHADLFEQSVRRAFLEARFVVSTRLDRMGARLEDPDGVFAGAPILSLVSDAIVPGDIQILGDHTPIVLMRDHQPTGGYPRIATIISADLDRFAQMRPGTELVFKPVTLQKARQVYLQGRAS